MQQVFVLVNRLLKKDPATNKRRLCVRTYKVCHCHRIHYIRLLSLFVTHAQVIPLSQRSGVVEWCEETCPLGEYLIGSPKDPKKGAHSRYHPNDWSSLACRKKLSVSELVYCMLMLTVLSSHYLGSGQRSGVKVDSIY